MSADAPTACAEETRALGFKGLAEIGLASLSYVTGPAEAIDGWGAREGLAPDILRQLSQAGLRFVSRKPDDDRSALSDCMSAAVAQAGLRADDIAAIETAASLALRRRGAVLIVLSALPPEGANFDARSMRLFGCGAACAVLVPGSGTFRLLATATASDVDLALGRFDEDRAAAFQDSWQLLRATIGELLDTAGSTARDIAFVCGSHVNAQALMAIAMAAGIARDRVWAGGLAELGHLYSADALVSLARLERSGGLRPGDRILVIGWSEWVISGMVLEYSP